MLFPQRSEAEVVAMSGKRYSNRSPDARKRWESREDRRAAKQGARETRRYGGRSESLSGRGGYRG